MIIYQGPSVLDGKPVIALATFGSSNRKTGGMIQTWILSAAELPTLAAKAGRDQSICGDCPHKLSNLNTCYVLLFQAPNRVYKTWKAGKYPEMDLALFYRRRVRFGSYGDPAAVPMSAWAPILAICNLDESSGYTHQLGHKNFDPAIGEFCQISVETKAQATRAWADGHSTYRVDSGGDWLPGEVECESTKTGLQCLDCGLCNGKRANVVIAPHGKRAHILARTAA